MKSQKLKRGDYTLHAYIEEGRGFFTGKENSTIDPIIIVKVFDKSKTTSAKNDIGGTAMVY